jgi:phenylpropionate dioxygenase-like ring-hydroxylating dioxygenase large terminal subunit
MRDLPYSYDFLVENLIDPSHVNFSHNGVIGNRCAPL